MGLVVVVLVGAVAVGRLGGGSLDRLGALRLRRWPLLVAAVLAQALGALLGDVGGVPAGAAYAAGLTASFVAAAAFLLANLRVAGVPLLTAGLALNALVVTANLGMPVSAYAAARAGLSTGPLFGGDGGSDARHVLADDDTRFRVLADVIPVPLPWRPEVLSAGDVLVAAGAGLLVVEGMRRRVDPAATGQGRLDSTRAVAAAPPPRPRRSTSDGEEGS